MKTNHNEKVEQFFNSPNGTTFMVGKVFAVKIPIGSDPRYGMIMTGSLYEASYEDSVPYPRRDFELSADSYVDNQTGLRILCDSYSPFQHRLNHTDNSITYSDAVSEVQTQIEDYLKNLPDEQLFLSTISVGDNPLAAKTLSDYENEALQKVCMRAYALGNQPEYHYDPFQKVDLDPRKINAARFAMSYLGNKEQFIRDTAEAALPMCAGTILHSRALEQERTRLFQVIEADPPRPLQKERDIRQAIAGKSSIWATFANGDDTLRMSIPTSAFTNDQRLSTYQLTTNDRKRLEEFLFPDKSQRWGADVQMDHIVALEYKNKLLFLDQEYYSQLPPQSPEKIDKSSISEKLKDANARAATQNSHHLTTTAIERSDIHEL